MTQENMMKARPVLISLLLMPLALSANAATKLPGPLIDTAWLAENKDDVVILDVRKDVKSFIGAPVYRKDKKTGKEKLEKVAGHIPGARLVDYKKVRATRVVDGKKIEKLIPERSEVEMLMRSLGVNEDSAVVIVSRGADNLDITMATRLYWQMKYFGHDNLSVLDGGVAQWLHDGHKTSAEPPAPVIEEGNWIATAQRDELLATTQEVADAIQTGEVQLVDNRSLSQYLGTYKKSYVGAKGHLPGAKSFPSELMTGPENKAEFQSRDELVALSTAMGIDPDTPSITYCNSGHLASGGWFIMHELLGNKQVQLYDGSLHEYTTVSKDLKTMELE
jgi:thiosulfate/3-mercaptopyruvate sulfurtransferase